MTMVVPKTNLVVLVQLDEVLAAVAYESVRISPWPVPGGLEAVLSKLHAAIVDRFPEELPGFRMRHMTRAELLRMLERELMRIPEFCAWNLSKAEIERGITNPEDPSRPPFQAVHRHSTIKPEHDFVDLSAHIRNTVKLAWDTAVHEHERNSTC